MEDSDHRAAWTAGFIDGEGTISINQKRRPDRQAPVNTIYVSVDQVDPRPLQLLRDWWGGSLGLYEQRCPEKHRPRWVWRISGAACNTMLQEIRPFLTVKGEVADLVVEFYASLPHAHPRYYKVPEKEVERRAAVVARLRCLNMRGVGPRQACG